MQSLGTLTKGVNQEFLNVQKVVDSLNLTDHTRRYDYEFFPQRNATCHVLATPAGSQGRSSARAGEFNVVSW